MLTGYSGCLVLEFNADERGEVGGGCNTILLEFLLFSAAISNFIHEWVVRVLSIFRRGGMCVCTHKVFGISDDALYR
jgi:hypothetical protein